jgi:hypothetical protein
MGQVRARGPRADDGLAVVRELVKAIHFLRLYPATHPFCAQAIESCFASLRRFHEWHGPLSLEVKREELLLDEALLPRGDASVIELATLLYPEGIRSVGLEVGMTQRELADLIDVLSGEIEEGEDDELFERDLLSALWRRDLPSVKTVVYDELSPAATRSERLDPFVAATCLRIRELVSQISPEATSDEVRDFELYLARAPRIATMDSEEARTAREELLGKLSHSFLSDDLGRAADIVAWAEQQEEEEDAPDPKGVSSFFVAVTLTALWEGRIEQATELLARVQTAGEAIQRSVLEHVATDAGLGMLLRAASLDAQAGGSAANAPASPDATKTSVDSAELAERYLARLGAAALPAIARAYPRQRDEEVKRLLRRSLQSLGGEALFVVGELAQSPVPWVVTDALMLLSDGGQAAPGWGRLVAIASDTAHPAQVEAKDLMDTITGAKERAALIAEVEKGATKPARLAAARKLKAPLEVELLERVTALVRGTAFASRDGDELEVVLSVYMRLAGPDAAPVLEELVERGKGLLVRQDLKKVADLARGALRILPRKKP